MDADRFDALSRSLSTTPSRRGALRLLAGSTVASLFALGAGDVDAHNALKACKKKSGKAKRKCSKKAKKHNATHTTACTPTCAATKPCGPDGCGGSCGSCVTPETCQSGQCGCTPNCTGKSCGDNGCGGSCGPCTGGTCSVTGVCTCGSKEFCRGTCVECNGGRILNPAACTCCWPNGTQPPGGCLDLDDGCCSGVCTTIDIFTGECNGIPDNGDCSFDAQCESGNCHPGGFCTGGIGG